MSERGYRASHAAKAAHAICKPKDCQVAEPKPDLRARRAERQSAKLPPSALDHVIERVNRTHPENKPFRVVKWTGRTFVELTPVT